MLFQSDSMGVRDVYDVAVLVLKCFIEHGIFWHDVVTCILG
jgi:hypothetical protein